MNVSFDPKNECYTPSYFVDPIRDAWHGFHLDPFSSATANKTVQADFYLDESQDALIQDWLSLCISIYPTFWVNPPYSRDLIQACVAKTLSYVGKAEIFLLINSQTSSKAYRACVKKCGAMLFPEKRIQFYNPYTDFSSSNSKDQTLFYFGVYPSRFERCVQSLGEVILRIH